MAGPGPGNWQNLSSDIDQVWPGGIPLVGQVTERSRAVNVKDIECFTEISGDPTRQRWLGGQVFAERHTVLHDDSPCVEHSFVNPGLPP